MKPTDHHEAVFAELEWYANGTLAAPERVRVREHLSGCAVCRSELQLIDRSMAAAVVAPQPDAAEVERALARTLARIEREAATAIATATAPAPAREAARRPRWFDGLAAVLRAAGARPLMLGAATVAAISLLVVAPMALRLGGNDDYRVLTDDSQTRPARVSLRVTFKGEISRAQVASLLGDAAGETTIERLGASVYALRLPPTADLAAVSRLHDRFARDERVDSVKLDVGAPR